jgi:hypothetical protein
LFMAFDWTISIGNLLTIVGFAVSGVGFVAMMRGDFRVLRETLNGAAERATLEIKNTNAQSAQRFESMASVIGGMQKVLDKLTDAALEQARREGRFEVLEDRLQLVSRRLDDFIKETKPK